LFEDIGRQILTYGEREDAASMCSKIDAVTKENIRDIVQKAIVKPPTVSTVGVSIDTVPKYDDITAMFGHSFKEQKRSWF